MMIRRSALLLLALAPAALPAQTPQTGQGRLEIVGEAPGACIVRDRGNATTTNASYSATGPSSGQIRITDMVNPANATARGSTIDLALEVVCNSPHRLVLRSENGGLLRAGAAGRGVGQGGFSEFLPYAVRATWLGRDGSLTSDAGAPVVMESSQGGAGQLSLAIVVPPGGTPLVAGDYRDAVILEFRAAN